jgi:hypothetical protein
VFRETKIKAESPRWANLTLTRQPQFHLPNLYVEEQGEPVDEEFQESEILNEEFEHEDVEDPSQGFVDWDSYDVPHCLGMEIGMCLYIYLHP